MNEVAIVISGARDALFTIILVSAPILIVSLLVGLVVSLFQAATQIHEQTIVFVPKIFAVFISLFFFGPWMLRTLMAFVTRMIMNINTIAR